MLYYLQVVQNEKRGCLCVKNANLVFYNGKLVNLYQFSEEHPEYSLFVIKGTWFEAALFVAVLGDNINDTDEALQYSYSDDDFDVVEKYDLNLGKVGGLL